MILVLPGPQIDIVHKMGTKIKYDGVGIFGLLK